MSRTAARSTLLRMIERHAVRDARAAVVAEHAEALEAEVPHDLDLIERHRALRVESVLGVALDLAAVAVAAQIRGDDGVVAREVARYGGPRDAALRRAVQEQDGRPAAADHGMDHGARRPDLLRAKAREEQRVDGERLLLRLCGGRRGSRQRDAACDECRGASQQVAPIHTFRGRVRLIAVSTHRRPLRFVPVAILARTASYSRTPRVRQSRVVRDQDPKLRS